MPIQETNHPPRHRSITSGIVMVLTIGLIWLAGAVLVVPRVLGGMSLNVLSSSMEPWVSAGDIIITKGVAPHQRHDLPVGQVISYLPFPDDPTLVTHRIVAKRVAPSGVTYVTQGDSNPDPDPWGPVSSEQVRFAALYHVPKLGWVRQWLGPKASLVPLIGAGLCLSYAVWGFASSFARTRARDSNTNEAVQRRVSL